MIFRKTDSELFGDDHAQEHHPIRIMLDNVQQQSGRWTGQGARDCREDGRHPEYKDHGRIAGR
jgi:hypothetical protein